MLQPSVALGDDMEIIPQQQENNRKNIAHIKIHRPVTPSHSCDHGANVTLWRYVKTTDVSVSHSNFIS